MMAAPRHAGAALQEVRIPPLDLDGMLGIPAGARGVVLFAHGSGSSRLSPRNRRVAAALQTRGLGTLLFDLLLPSEEDDRRKVFDIALLAARLLHATEWVGEAAATRGMAIGYFGASTGAAAALVAAADAKREIGAVVSRGGRPDLAGDALGRVRAPTLLIVGALDSVVLDLNRTALAALRCERELAIVPGATHLFEELGAMEEVIGLAAPWFEDHLGRRSSRAGDEG